MSDVTRILSAIDQGDPSAAAQLLSLVYDELRRLAAQKLALEKPGQTLQATDLVHEVYLRLVVGDQPQQFKSKGHFYAAAAVAMRRILVDAARRKGRLKRGGGLARQELTASVAVPETPESLLALDDALAQLAETNPQAAELVQLRYFAGLTVDQAAETIGISPRKADFLWQYARAWLLQKLEEDETAAGGHSTHLAPRDDIESREA
jgi:RNA polymerase sigma factor (TIGR02999 family)